MEIHKELLKIVRENFLDKYVTIQYSDTTIGKYGEYLSDVATMVKIQEPGAARTDKSGFFEIYVDNRDRFLKELEENIKFMQDIPAFCKHHIDQEFIERYVLEVKKILRPSLINCFSINDTTTSQFKVSTDDRRMYLTFNNFTIIATKC
jgi:hypothetical protein